MAQGEPPPNSRQSSWAGGCDNAGNSEQRRNSIAFDFKQIFPAACHQTNAKGHFVVYFGEKVILKGEAVSHRHAGLRNTQFFRFSYD